MSDIIAKCQNCNCEGLLSMFLVTTTFTFIKHTNKERAKSTALSMYTTVDVARVHLLFRCPQCGKEVGVNVDGLSK